MSQPCAPSFNALVAHFLGERLPDEMAEAISFPTLPSEVQGFISRMFFLMQQAEFPAKDFTPRLIWQLAHVIPGFLPCAWRGMVPPLTLPKRNAKIDAYVVKHTWAGEPINPLLIDMGCGFPPTTAADTAAALPDWQVFGVDRSFADYVVHESSGNYACFNTQGEFQYFQPRMDRAGIRMYRNPAEVRLRFEKTFTELHPLLSQATDLASETVEKDGKILVYRPLQNYAAPNLTFIESEMADVQAPPAHVIRCMNTLMYFTPETRQYMLAKAGALLAESGLLIAGSNLMSGAGGRYTVYKKDSARLVPTEFALSLDNLRPTGVMPWYTLHDNDPEALLLAGVLRQVRADQPFWRLFTKRLDELMAHYGLFQRRGNGFLYASEEEKPAAEFTPRVAQLWWQVEEEGFTDGAVDALNRAGHIAWKNRVGDIAIRPNLLPLNLPDHKERR